MKWINRIKLVMTAIAFTLAFPANAITDVEFTMLPAYCAVKIRDNDPQAKQYWEAQLGSGNWLHMHHYCGGLAALNRYYGQNAYERGRSLYDAVWEFNYVLKNTKPDFYLRADFHYNRGKALLLQGKAGPALGDFQKALEYSPGMPSASIELADLYKKSGKKEMALATLKTALERFPANKGLRRRYQEMGGDLASIPTTLTPAVQSQPAPVESDKPGNAVPAQAEPTPPVEQSKPEVIDQKIGSETNPWCRFCPDPPAPKSDKQ